MMYKNILSSLLLMLFIMLLTGCKASLEKVYTLGEHIDPDDPKSRRLAASATPSAPAVSCQKELAFGVYCLGGRIQPLLDQRPPFRQRTEAGLRVFDFRERRGLTVIRSFQGRILSVSRDDRPANWTTLLASRARIAARYGEADDESTFASDIDTPRRREFAVYKGRAKAHYVWRKPGWRIDLVWDNIRTIRVTFLDDELNRRYLASRRTASSQAGKPR